MIFTPLDREDPFERTLSQEMADRFNDTLREAMKKAWNEGYAEGAIAARGLDALGNPYTD